MSDHDQNGLTEPERAEFASLPREREPGRLLEERTVQALRNERLVGRPLRPRWYRRAPLVAAGLAASVALFASGAVVGQWLGSRTVAASMAEANHRTAMEVAAAVQRAGSAYVMALGALTQMADTTNDVAIAQGREAAVNSLYAAVRELVLLAPDDPLAVTLRQELERTRPGEESDVRQVTNLVWF
jgi:hypothetical protein